MFIDRAKINIKAGDGGRGCVSFRREAHVPYGGPNGGDGGDGGDIILVVDENVATLLDFHHMHHFKAGRGEHGQGKNKTGASGEDKIIKIPPGTIVRDADTGELIGDFTGELRRMVVAKGGKGGKGNARFVTSSNRVPRYAQPGEEGKERNLELELKLIADVGLVGFPNAGKSTLISKLSAAKPKIAAYPFTTLQPNLGVVKVDDFNNFVMADIPGLIEGAHQGKGLGDEFLRHVERTSVLVYILDVMVEDIWNEYQILRNELGSHDEMLLTKPYLIVFNKIDLLVDEFEINKKWKEEEIFFISALTGEGLNKLKYEIHNLLKEKEKEEDEWEA